MAARSLKALAAAATEKLRLALRPYPPAERYLIGVSGGRDSVALLHGLREAGYRRLVVCHLDHGLRAEGASDAAFTADLARGWEYPVVIKRLDAGALKRQAKTSLETAARNARRAFFAAVGGRRRCRRLFLAHHADDQVETFLFRLLRGAGTAGLAAMQSPAPLPATNPMWILRPLLAVWRVEIDAYVQTHGLPFREDATNLEHAHTRNRLRGRVLPLLERELGRNVRPALWRAADLLAAEESWMASLLDAEPPCTVRLPMSDLQAQPLAKQRRLIRRWLLAQDIPGVGFEEVDAIRTLLCSPEGPAKINLAAGWHARRRKGALFLEPPGACAEASGRGFRAN